MKKSLIALAVLGAFAGAAAAQSSATLYGKIDMGYGIGNTGSYEGKKGVDSKFQQWGNSNSTSRWGLKGQEDLGNGTAVYFNLESKIDPENGSTGSKLFDRAAIVGFKGGFGAIQAGRQTTVMNNVLGQFDVSGSPNLTSSLGNAGLSAISQRTTGITATGNNYSRFDSALAYVSPNFSGFAFQAAVVLKNDDILARGANAKTVYTLGASYKWSGLTVGAAYESKLWDNDNDMKGSWGVGAKYDFTSFLISAGYFDNHLKADGRGFYVGAAVPFGAFTVGAQYAYNASARDAAGDKYKPQAWELFAKYKLSDRTQLYAQYGGINSKAEQFNAIGDEGRKYSASFGVIHNF